MGQVIALNLKTYAESTGKGGERLCSVADKAAAANPGAEIIVCPQAPFLQKAAKKAKHSLVFAQACEAAPQGQSTGAITPEALAAAGCKGTLLNHAERKLPHEQARQVVERCNGLGLKVIACAANVEEGIALAKFSPWAVAVEPPELIGSGISVSTAKPEVVASAVSQIKAVNPQVVVLVGAGISTPADVAKSIELGAQGVLLASAYAKSKRPRKLLAGMVSALQKA